MNTVEILATLKKLGKPETAAIYKRHGSGDNNGQWQGQVVNPVGRPRRLITANTTPPHSGQRRVGTQRRLSGADFVLRVPIVDRIRTSCLTIRR